MDNHKKPIVWTKVRCWVSKYHQLAWVACGMIILFIGGFIAYNVVLSHKPTASAEKPIAKTEDPKPIVEAPKFFSPLTGMLVADEAITKLPVTGMMIENSPEARPQSGIKNSGIVFEAIAEGGITRFLVLYQEQKPQLIGPVRSVRPYYIDWAAAFDCSIGHIGGSAAALEEVRNGNYRDIDQFFNSGTYWRSTDRYAPHNVYTSFEKLDALNKSKGYTTSTFNGFSRIDGKAAEVSSAISINVNISSYLFNSSYIYDKTSNTYARSQAGAPHLDRESGQITPSSVVILNVDEALLYDDGGHSEITTIGEGKVTIFQNGIVTVGTWHKTSKTSQITFTDEAGKDIPLVRGQTWITALPNIGGSLSWQ